MAITSSARIRKGLLVLALAAVAGLALLASACGGSSGQGVAQVGSTPATTNGSASPGSSRGDPWKYSACMRKNGVPKFPDPDSNGNLGIQGGSGLDPNSPQFKAADKKCQKFLPKGGGETPSPKEQAKALQEALKYSACIRSHGVPSYPDPKLNGEGGIELDIPKGSGFNPDSPQFKAAQKACKDLAPGANGGATQQKSAGGSS